MKCEIIRDLLPLYCDNLTSEESNEEIRNHLNECKECAEIYGNMSTKEIAIKEKDINIKPLKKVKKKFLVKLAGGILGTAVVFSGLFVFFFVGVIPVKSDKVSMEISAEYRNQETYQKDKNGKEKTIYKECADLDINIIVDTDCITSREKVTHEYSDDGKIIIHEEVTIFPVTKIPFDDRGKYPNEFITGFSDVHEGDTLTFHYLDCDVEYDLYELFNEYVNK